MAKRQVTWKEGKVEFALCPVDGGRCSTHPDACLPMVLCGDCGLKCCSDCCDSTSATSCKLCQAKKGA